MRTILSDLRSARLDALREALYRATHVVKPDQKLVQQLTEAIHEAEQTQAAEQAQSRSQIQAQRRKNQGPERDTDEGRIPTLI